MMCQLYSCTSFMILFADSNDGAFLGIPVLSARLTCIGP